MKRWIKRIALTIGGLIVAAVLVGASYEQIMRWQATKEFPVQGRLIDIGGRHMQIDCRGSGTPIVVFEAGLFGGALGIRRTFILHAHGSKLPSDLLGRRRSRPDRAGSAS